MIRATSKTHALAAASSRNPNWIARQVEDRIVHTKVGLVREQDQTHLKPGTAIRLVGSIIGHLAVRAGNGPKQIHPRVVDDIQG